MQSWYGDDTLTIYCRSIRIQSRKHCQHISYRLLEMIEKRRNYEGDDCGFDDLLGSICQSCGLLGSLCQSHGRRRLGNWSQNRKCLPSLTNCPHKCAVKVKFLAFFYEILCCVFFCGGLGFKFNTFHNRLVFLLMSLSKKKRNNEKRHSKKNLNNNFSMTKH